MCEKREASGTDFAVVVVLNKVLCVGNVMVCGISVIDACGKYCKIFV